MIIVAHIFKNKWIAEKLFAYCKHFPETLTFAKKKSTPLVPCFHLNPSELREDCRRFNSHSFPVQAEVGLTLGVLRIPTRLGCE